MTLPARLRLAGVASGLRRALLYSAVASSLGIASVAARSAEVSPCVGERSDRTAGLDSAAPSPQTLSLVVWVVASCDHGGTGFVVVDKKQARIHGFSADARLRGSAPVPIGAAKGDDTVPGIGERPLAMVQPEERTTPAGRFVGERGRNASGEDVVWVDYDAAVSMHRVRTTSPQERRLERLASPSADDNRISYGCINVPVGFTRRMCGRSSRRIAR